MIASDLAEFYGVETKILNRGVRRNLERFPEDFMFQLTKDEAESLRIPIWHLKAIWSWTAQKSSSLCFHGARHSDVFKRFEQQAGDRGRHL